VASNKVEITLAAKNKTEAAFNQVNNSLLKLTKSAERLKSVFKILLTAKIMKDAVMLADSYTALENKLRVVTDSTKELESVMEGLLKTAQSTRSSFEGSVTMYSRLALSTRELSLNQTDLLNLTKSLNQAIIISGANAQEAQAGMIQLSQGLASGTLRGDELRSVLEQLPVVADVIAKELGVTRGELRQLGSDGKITAVDIINAFKNAEKELDESFNKTVPTVSQNMLKMKDAASFAFSEFNKGSGITRNLSIFIGGLAEKFVKAGASAKILGVEAAKLFKFATIGAIGLAGGIGDIFGLNNLSEGARKAIREVISEIGTLDDFIEETKRAMSEVEIKLKPTLVIIEKDKSYFEQIERLVSVVKSASQTIEDSLVSAFKDSGQDMTALFKNTVNTIIAEAYRLLIIKPLLASLFGTADEAGALKGFLGSLGKGGGSTTTFTPTAKPRAEGGPVSAGSPFLVGEKGPEIFIPGQDGGILANSGIGGMTQNININVSAVDSNSVARFFSSDEARTSIISTMRQANFEAGIA
jgi:tape measure domain-containing protein